jgi:predicted nucleotidyltransferase
MEGSKNRARRGIKSDGMPDAAMLDAVTRAIVAAARPEKVILFGSAARGEMTKDSDLDVLVIKDGEHYRAVAKRIYLNLPARTRRVDLVVATSRDIERHRDKPYYVIAPALREGRVLYDRTPAT